MKHFCSFIQRIWLILKLLSTEVQRHQLTTHVAALTYSSVLSVVPFLALILALGRGFGMEQYIEQQLRQQLNVQDSVIDQLMGFANSYIARTQDDVIIGVSILILIFTLISLVNNIESKFNTLWEVKAPRSLFAFSLSYLGLLVFLILAIIFLSGVWLYVLQLLDYLPGYNLIQSYTFILLFLLKWIISGGVFALMFKFIPNTQVHWHSTLIPALATGFLFCLIQQFYISGQMFLSSYNVVYGSFAVLPLLMAWIYATWFITLGGVQLCRVLQEWDNLSGALPATHLSPHHRNAIALALTRAVALAHINQRPSPSAEDLSKTIGIARRAVLQELQRLVDAHILLTYAPETETLYHVHTDVYQLTVSEFLRRLAHHNGEEEFANDTALPEDWQRLTQILQLQYAHPDMNVLVKDL